MLVSGEDDIKSNIENDIISYLKKHVIFDDFQVIGDSNQPKALFILGGKRVEVVPGEINLLQPTEIDVLLHDSNGSTYIVYILEVTGEIMQATLKDIVLLASDYFSGNYQVKERRGLFKKDHYLEFSLPIINNIAVKSKHTKLRSIST